MKKNLFLLSAFLLFGLSAAYAQSKTVSGQVLSAEDGSSLPGVSIVIKGTSRGTQTDGDGRFRLENVSASETLVFSFIGFLNKEIAVGNQSVINVSLENSGTQLEELVVTGFGIERDRKQLGYGTTTLKAEQLTTAKVMNVSNALAGKVPGVMVTGTGGAFTGSGIIIRGYTTFTGSNQPLYVIDGMPVDNGGGGTPLQNGPSLSNRIGDLNPEDIENMTVLKGAAATALYGSRAASGVILITTKKANRRSKNAITLTSNVSFGNVNRLPEYQNQYAQGSNGNFIPGSITASNMGMGSGSFTSWGPEIKGQTVTNFFGDQETLKAYPNNVSDLFRTATNLQNTISFSGGSEKTDYRVSYGNTREQYVLDNNDLQRHNLSVNASSNITTKLRVGTSFSYVNNKSRRTQQGNQLSNPLFRAYFTPRSYDLTNLPFENAVGEQLWYGGEDNPYWSIKHVTFNDEINRVFGNINARYDFTSWLFADLKVGTDFFLREAKGFDEIGIRGGGNTSAQGVGGVLDNKSMSRNLNSYFTLTGNKTFGDFALTATLGSETVENFSRFGNMTGRSLLVRGFNNIKNTLTYVPSYGSSKSRIVGVFADFIIDYKSYLSLNIKARNDWASTLSKGNRSIFYPAAALSFVLTEAVPSLKENKVIDLIKIRTNIGEVGKGAGVYATDSYYVQSNPGDGFGPSIVFPFNGSLGYNLSNTAGNPNIRPEFTREMELGLELGFFKNRLHFEGSLYQRKTRDVILSVPSSAVSGVTSYVANAGKLTTNGVEFMISGTPVLTNTFKWDIGLNFTKFRSMVDELAPGVENIFLGGFTDPHIRLVAGDQYGQIYGQDYARDDQGRMLINPNTGLPLPSGVVTKIGNPNPDYLMGITNAFNYKGVNLSFLIDIRKGGMQYSRNIADIQRNGVAIETAEYPRFNADGSITKPYLFEGVYASGEKAGQPNTTYVSAEQYWGNAGKHTAGVGFLYDTSWLRLREAALSYALPKSVTDKSPFGNVEIGVFGRNLFLRAPNYPHFDPEQNALGISNAQGLEFNSLPATRTYGFNLKLTL